MPAVTVPAAGKYRNRKPWGFALPYWMRTSILRSTSVRVAFDKREGASCAYFSRVLSNPVPGWLLSRASHDQRALGVCSGSMTNPAGLYRGGPAGAAIRLVATRQRGLPETLQTFRPRQPKALVDSYFGSVNADPRSETIGAFGRLHGNALAGRIIIRERVKTTPLHVVPIIKT